MRQIVTDITTALVALAVITMLSELSWRRKTAERGIRDYLLGSERFVDMGVSLRTVVPDPAGAELISGKPPLRVIREHAFGGMVDTKAFGADGAPRARFVGSSRNPVVWYCSEDQERILLRDDPVKLATLVYGSEGAGKTRLLGMWHGLRVLEHLGEHREGGQTAPTDTRLNFIRLEFGALFPSSWHRHFKAADLFVFCDGTRIQLVSTYRQSKAQGSPIQGFNWSWCGRDEAQDQVEVHDDIESRGRAARDGGKLYRQLATATAKDNSDWRTLKDRMDASGRWFTSELLIFRSPFIDQAFIESKRATMSPREFLRRFGDPIKGISDLPPERADYPSWSRNHNLIRLPGDGLLPGWADVTASELRGWGTNFAALFGHDPGSLFDVSEGLRAFQINRALTAWERQIGFPKMRPFWVVVEEITTEQTTTEQHTAAFLERIRARGWNLLDRFNRPVEDGKRVLVRADPYGNSDSKPDRSCYTVLRNAGLTVHPAAYNADGTKPGRVPKKEGIELCNTLFCNALGERRLFIAVNERGEPVAPMLVKAIESNEKNEHGESETQRKDRNDLSHWVAALRYALWAVERPRLQISNAGAAA